MADNFTDKHIHNIIYNQLSRDKYYQLLKEGKVNEDEFYITNDAFKDNAGGLDVLDIGQSLYIDETQGLRRWLNGSWVDINDNTRGFYERLNKAVLNNPNIVCTNEEYESFIANSTFGQCGKFVIDNINKQVRLPKVIYTCGALNINDLADLDTQRILVAKKEPTDSDKSWYNWYSDGWLEQGGYVPYRVAGYLQIQLFIPFINNYYSLTGGVDTPDTAFPNNGHSVAFRNKTLNSFEAAVHDDASLNAGAWTWEAKGYANKPTIQDINITDGNNVRYPYFIQIATGLTTVVNIESDVQLNNPYTLGESKYSPIILNNLSWLSADIKDNTRELYPTYYDMLLDIYRGKKAVGGLTVKLSTDEDITRLDHVINLTNNTFNLPALNGTENGPIKSLNDIIDYKVQLTESPVLFVAPYNGWFYIEFPYEADKYVSLKNNNTRQRVVNTPASTSAPLVAQLFCNKGDTVEVTYSATQAVSVFEFQIASNLGHLYYYVGDTVQNANLINAGKLADIITRDRQYYLVDSWTNTNKGWYRKYSDGWLEQGGYISTNNKARAWGTTTITFHTPFKDTNYNCSLISNGISDGAYGVGGYPNNFTTKSCQMQIYNNGGQAEFWYACGYYK